MGQPSIKRNYAYKLLYEILLVITPLITAPYISRVLGPDGVGIYSFTFSNLTFFTLVATLGTISYGTREIARCRDSRDLCSKTFWEIECVTIITTILALIGWMVLIYTSDNNRIYYICWIPQLLSVAFDISWLYTGLERVGYTVLWNAVCKILGIILILLFVKDPNDVALYIIIVSGTLLLGNVSMWLHLRHFVSKVELKRLELKDHFKETLIYFIPAAATSIYTVLDKSLIGVITHDNYENGYYEEATKIINICKSLVFTSVNSVMNARMAYLFEKERYEEIKEKLHKCLSFILLLAFGCSFGILGVSDRFVPLFFGSEYVPSVILVNLMSPLVIIIGISNCLGAQYYTPSGKRKISARYIIVGAIINLIANLLLIPTYSATGAVIGSLIAEATITVLYIRNCDSYITFADIGKLCWKRAIAAIVMFCGIKMAAQQINSNTLVILASQIIFGIIIYFVILLILHDDLVDDAIRYFKRRLKI